MNKITLLCKLLLQISLYISIHNKIDGEIDDLFYKYENEYNVKIEYSFVEKIMENTKTVALRRY